jgi:hypothetical protein
MQDDIARFLPQDPQELIAASLACAWCLHRAAHVRVERDESTGVAVCTCGACGRTTRVALAPQQLMRLLLAPPPATRIAPVGTPSGLP